MGRMKDQAIDVNPFDEAFTAGFQVGRGTAGDNGSGFEAPDFETAYVKPWEERARILRQIRELAEDSDWVRVSDIEELLG